jgi:hypothetical protein
MFQLRGNAKDREHDLGKVGRSIKVSVRAETCGGTAADRRCFA